MELLNLGATLFAPFRSPLYANIEACPTLNAKADTRLGQLEPSLSFQFPARPYLPIARLAAVHNGLIWWARPVDGLPTTVARERTERMPPLRFPIGFELLLDARRAPMDPACPSPLDRSPAIMACHGNEPFRDHSLVTARIAPHYLPFDRLAMAYDRDAAISAGQGTWFEGLLLLRWLVPSGSRRSVFLCVSLLPRLHMDRAALRAPRLLAGARLVRPLDGYPAVVARDGEV